MSLMDRLFPPVCLLCGDDGVGDRDLCTGCYADLSRGGPACARCACPLPAFQTVCGACLERPPAWARVLAPLIYDHPADWVVRRFKFQGHMNCGRLLARLLVDAALARDEPLPDCIVPVPLHPARLRERGFNQAALLARRVAGELGLVVDAGLLERVRPTPSQSALPAQARRANVRRAFRVIRPVPYRHVALLDDVLTTGHTAGECVRALTAAGAVRAELWVASRTRTPAGVHRSG